METCLRSCDKETCDTFTVPITERKGKGRATRSRTQSQQTTPHRVKKKEQRVRLLPKDADISMAFESISQAVKDKDTRQVQEVRVDPINTTKTSAEETMAEMQQQIAGLVAVVSRLTEEMLN